jgi:hypothetical protein
MSRTYGWYALLILPFAATLFPGLYNRIDPALFGLPFFYWFQMAWVIVTSLVLAAIAYGTRTPDDV